MASLLIIRACGHVTIYCRSAGQKPDRCVGYYYTAIGTGDIIARRTSVAIRIKKKVRVRVTESRFRFPPFLRYRFSEVYLLSVYTSTCIVRIGLQVIIGGDMVQVLGDGVGALAPKKISAPLKMRNLGGTHCLLKTNVFSVLSCIDAVYITI